MSLVEDAKSGILLNTPNSSCTSSLSGLYKSNAWHIEEQDLERFRAKLNGESELTIPSNKFSLFQIINQKSILFALC